MPEINIVDAYNNRVDGSLLTRLIFLAFFLTLFICATAVVASAEQDLQLVESSVQKIPTGTITGRFIVKGGGSMEGGRVLFYTAGDAPPPNMTKYIRVPNTSLSTEIMSDGSFSTVLPEGEYYFSALRRNSSEQLGMPSTGDYSYRYYKPNSSELKEFTIKEGEKIDFGVLEAHPWPGTRPAISGNTIIEGTIQDIEGNPLENCYVFAFSTPQMQGNVPLFISTPTKEDGKFTLNIAGDIKYYLLARDSLGGGQLLEGQVIGFFGGRKPVGITLSPGKILKNITITVLRQGHRGPDIQLGEDKNLDPKNKGSKKASLLPQDTPTPGQHNNNQKK